MGVNNRKILLPRDTGRLISQKCEDVSIDDEKVKQTAAVLADAYKRKKFSLEGWKNHALHPKVADEKAIDFIFVTDTLNFSFWPDIPGEKYMVEYNGKPYTGFWSLVAALKRAEDEGKPVFSAKFMANIDEDQLRHIFRSDSNVEIPLLSERLQAYKEGGKVLLAKYGGKFSNCVRLCDKDALALRDLLVENFSSFRDEAVFEGQQVAFYKRAQLVAADIWNCFEGRGLGEFKNINELTMFADYRVPQSLEYFGILKYSSKLKQVLAARTILQPGHRYELEIRGASIQSIENLVAVVKDILIADGVLKEDLEKVNPVTADNFLWDYARAHREKMRHLEIHLVRSIFY